MQLHNIEFHGHIFCIYKGVRQIPLCDKFDTFSWRYLATPKLQEATEFVWNEVDGLGATDCHVVTPVTVAILINRMALYDSYVSSSSTRVIEFLEVVHVWRGITLNEKVGEKNYVRGANDYDYGMSNWSVFPGEVEVKLKT